MPLRFIFFTLLLYFQAKSIDFNDCDSVVPHKDKCWKRSDFIKDYCDTLLIKTGNVQGNLVNFRYFHYTILIPIKTLKTMKIEGKNRKSIKIMKKQINNLTESSELDLADSIHNVSIFDVYEPYIYAALFNGNCIIKYKGIIQDTIMAIKYSESPENQKGPFVYTNYYYNFTDINHNIILSFIYLHADALR